MLAVNIIFGQKVHFIVIMTITIIRTFEVHERHSGFEFPWNPLNALPFYAGAKYHNFHYLKGGHFGCTFTIWDSLIGANDDFIMFLNAEYQEAKEKADDELLNVLAIRKYKMKDKVGGAANVIGGRKSNE